MSTTRRKDDRSTPTRSRTPAPSPRRTVDGTSLTSLARDDTLGVWVIDRQLGKGGMAAVYKCHNRHAPRIEAAIKLLDPALSHEGTARARFVREAEILSGLDHANIVRVSSVNLDNSPPYLEMEYVRGQSIEGELALRGAMPVRQSLELADQLASALIYLHGKGVYHRDIKPLNLLLQPDGQLKLVDFGLAVEATGDRITLHGSAFGTPSYAPPEWGERGELDPVSWDLYALGVVLYEMLTGEVAFPVMDGVDNRRSTMQVLLAKQRTVALDPGAGYPRRLRALIRGLTARDPSLRPRSAREVKDAVRSVLDDPTTEPDDVEELWAELEGRPDYEADRVAERAEAAADTVVSTTRPITPLATRPAFQDGRPALVLGGIALVGALVVVAITVLLPAEPQPVLPTVRPVAVVVAGVPDTEQMAVDVAGAVPSGRDGFTWTFREVPAGQAQVEWALGGGCATDVCPGPDCPTWCTTGSRQVDIPAGHGVYTLPITVTPPLARDVQLTLEGMPPRAPVVADLDAESVPVDSGVARIDGVRPGLHVLTVRVGACPDEAIGCADTPSPCPPGCASWREEVVVPSGGGPVEQSMAMRGWTPPAPAPLPDVASAAEGPVTRAAFATWLADRPDWHRDTAIASGTADQGYLDGWVEAVPPEPADAAMVSVSWWAAEAFCRTRGGLLALDAEPLTWTASAEQPSHEWRVDAGNPAWRREDGASSHAGPWRQTNSATGFRCAE